MWNNQFIIEILKITVSVITPFAAYFLGRSSRIDARRLTASEKRLKKYYWPLMKRYMISFYWDRPYSNSDFEVKSIFFELIVNNSYLARKETQKIIPQFYIAYLDVLEYGEDNPDFDSSCMAKLDTEFSQVIDSVYKEYAKLCKQLGYPAPLKPKPPMIYEQEN